MAAKPTSPTTTPTAMPTVLEPEPDPESLEEWPLDEFEAVAEGVIVTSMVWSGDTLVETDGVAESDSDDAEDEVEVLLASEEVLLVELGFAATMF